MQWLPPQWPTTVDNNMNTLLKWLAAILLMVLILIALIVLFDLASTQYDEWMLRRSLDDLFGN